MDQSSLIRLLGQVSENECPDCLWPGSCSTWTAPSAGTIFRPPSAPATLPVRVSSRNATGEAAWQGITG